MRKVFLNILIVLLVSCSPYPKHCFNKASIVNPLFDCTVPHCVAALFPIDLSKPGTLFTRAVEFNKGEYDIGVLFSTLPAFSASDGSGKSAITINLYDHRGNLVRELALPIEQRHFKYNSIQSPNGIFVEAGERAFIPPIVRPGLFVNGCTIGLFIYPEDEFPWWETISPSLYCENTSRYCVTAMLSPGSPDFKGIEASIAATTR